MKYEKLNDAKTVLVLKTYEKFMSTNNLLKTGITLR